MSKNHVQVQHVVARAEWHGPLPPSSEIERYQSLLPDAAERLFAMAEREQSVRHKIQQEEAELAKFEAEGYNTRTKRGQLIGAAVAVSFLIGSVVCAYLDQTAIGVALVGATIVGLVNSLVNPKRR